MPHGICLEKNHLIIIMTNQNDYSKVLVEMINKKCQLKLGQKVHGPVTMDKFKTICPK